MRELSAKLTEGVSSILRHFPGHGENRPLRDVGRVVADALKILGHHQQIRRRLAVIRILADGLDQLALHRVKQIVHHIVAVDDPVCLFFVALGKRS